jgi:hypothetical protein
VCYLIVCPFGLYLGVLPAEASGPGVFLEEGAAP